MWWTVLVIKNPLFALLYLCSIILFAIMAGIVGLILLIYRTITYKKIEINDPYYHGGIGIDPKSEKCR